MVEVRGMYSKNKIVKINATNLLSRKDNLTRHCNFIVIKMVYVVSRF